MFLKKYFDDRYHRRLFERQRVQYETFPRIDGRLLIRDSARGNFTISFSREVRLNSGFQENPVGGPGQCVFWMIGENPSPRLTIKDHAGLSNTIIAVRTSVEIGERCFIGGGVNIYDSDFHAVDYRVRETRDVANSKPVVIGAHVFIGALAIILKGVTIGEGAVVGAGSVVSRSIPPGEIWAGNPARFVKSALTP